MKINPIELVDSYLNRIDWRVKENANSTYSLQALNSFLSGEIVKQYWLGKIYKPAVARAHTEGFYHIHDLTTLGAYCVGWDLVDLLKTGFKGAPGKIESRPAKHFKVALAQVTNFMFTLQGETAGAQAFSNFDTLIAPFIRYDGLDYGQVRKIVQGFVYNMNVPTRVGFQTPFTNTTHDLTIPRPLADKPVIIGGKELDDTYSDFQEEMDMFNLAFQEIMSEGDAKGRPFTFPIPTYNVSKDWDWDSPVIKNIMKMTAKYGLPYFANFVNSSLDPDDIRSMCCRLRLNTKELKTRTGGLFASAPLTGSIGVVTLNMGRIGYLSKDDTDFVEMVSDLMDLAKQALMQKREFLEKATDAGLYPYSQFYLRSIKRDEGQYWTHHFNTIGLIGMNEGLQNFLGKGIWEQESQKFALRIMDFMLDKLTELQEETGHLFNLEATPGEGASYRLARVDKQKYPDIKTAGSKKPYYTNSTQLPVNFTDDIFALLDNQTPLQIKYTGGTVVHIYLGEAAPPDSVEELIKKVIYNYPVPYITVTPTYSICPIHGYVPGRYEHCPYPHTEEELIEAGLIQPEPVLSLKV